MVKSKSTTLDIRTPEGITFSLTLAGPIVRFLAYVIDLLCIAAGMSVLNKLLGLFWIVSPDVAAGFSIVTYFVMQVGYGIALEWLWRGQTLGKRLLGLRVMDVQGLHLHFSQIVIRNLLRFVDSLPVFYLVGGVTCLFSRQAQRLGDLAANTIVVRTVPAPEPDVMQLVAGKYNSLRDYPHLAARLRQHVSPQTADIALYALLRRNQLDAPVRLEIFTPLSTYLKTLVAFPPEATDGISDEQYVRNVVDIVFQ